MRIDLSNFRANYSVDVATEISPDECDYNVQYERAEPAEGGLCWTVPVEPWHTAVLRVVPEGGDGWTGAFEPGLDGISGIYSTPCPTIMCVIVRGQGYWVPVGSPMDFEELSVFPVKVCKSVPQSQLIVFVSFTNIAAYNEAGLAWRTPRISWDGIKIDNITQRQILGRCWHPPTGKWVGFTVEISDGTCVGEFLNEFIPPFD